MVSKIYDFADWTGFTGNKGTDPSSRKFQSDSNPLNFMINSGNGGATVFDPLDLGFTWGLGAQFKNADWDAYVNFPAGSDNVGAVLTLTVKLTLSDASTILIISKFHNIDGNQGLYADATKFKQLTDAEMQDSNWIKIRTAVSVNDRIVYASYGLDSSDKPGSFIGETEIKTIVNGKTAYPVKIECVFEQSAGIFWATRNDWYYDNVEISNSADAYDPTYSVSGLSLGAAQIQSVFARSALGGGGRAVIGVKDEFLAAFSTVQGEIGNQTVITDDIFGLEYFRGELNHARVTGPHTMQLELTEATQKVLKFPTNTNPVLYSGIVRYLKDNYILDVDASFSAAWGASTHLVGFEKTDLKTDKHGPSSVTNSKVPDATAGDIENCYFNDQLKSTTANHPANVYYASYTPGNFVDSNRINLQFEFFVKSGSTIQSMVLNIQVRSNTHVHNYSIYDFNGVAWEFISNNVAKIESNPYVVVAEQLSRFKQVTIDLSDLDGPFANYIDAQGAENASGYQEYDLFFGVDVINQGNGVLLEGVIEFAELVITYDTEQTVGVAHGRLDASTTSTKLNFEATGWGSIVMPSEDGITGDDLFYISKHVGDILADCFTNSAIGFTLDWNVTGDSSYGDFKDLSNATLYDVLQGYCDLLNAFFWFANDGADKIFVRSLDNATSTGLTIVASDIWKYNQGGFNYDEDADNLRTSLKVVGNNVIATQAITPEYTLDVDDAIQVLQDQSILTQWQATKKATEVQWRHKYSIKEFRLKFNLTRATKDWSTLGIGKLISMNITNFVFSSDELLIIAMELKNDENTGWQDITTLTLQRRYDS